MMEEQDPSSVDDFIAQQKKRLNLSTEEPSSVDDFVKAQRQRLASAPPPEQPKSADERFPDQARRQREADEWSIKSGGGDRPIDRVMRGIGIDSKKQGPFGIRPSDLPLPFQDTITAIGRAVTGGKSDAQKMKEADEAYEAGKATDEQLARRSIRNYEQNRSKQIGSAGRIAQGVAQAPAIVAESLVGGAAVKAAGKGLGMAKAVDGAKTPLGIGLQSAGVQAVATPLTPGLWLKEAEQRQAENGGNLLDPKNAGLPMFRAAFTNAIMGHIGASTKGMGTVRGLGNKVAGLPAEQALADGVAGAAEDLFVKLGMPEKLKTETGYGTFGMIASGKYGEALEKVAVESILGTIASKMHGGKSEPVVKLKTALDSLHDAGVPREKAGEVIQDALNDPKSAPEGPIRDFVEAMKPQEPVKEAPKTPADGPIPEVVKPDVVPENVVPAKPQDAEYTGPERRTAAGQSPTGQERRKSLERAVGNRLEDVGDGIYTVTHGDRFLAVSPAGENRVSINFDFNEPVEGSTTKPAGKGIGTGTKAIFTDLTKIVDELKKTGTQIEFAASDVKGEGGQRSRSEVYERLLTKAGYEQVQKGDANRPSVWAPKSEVPPAKSQSETPPPDAPPPEVNSIKNDAPEAFGANLAFTEAERVRLGMAERGKPESNGQFYQELQSEMVRIGREDPNAHVRLTDELIKTPRAINKIENALLTRRMIELFTDHEQAQSRLTEAKASGDPARIVEAENAESFALGKYREAMEASESTGTVWGQAGVAKKMMLKRDQSLANLVIQREKTLGRSLSKAERKELEDFRAMKDDIEKRLAESIAEDAARAEKAEVSKSQIGKRTKAARSEVDAAWEELRAATKGKLFSVEGAIAEAAIPAAKLARAYIKLGVAKFADFVEAVRLKSGKPLTPEAEAILKRGWDDTQTELAAEKRDKRIETNTAKIEAKIEAGDIAKTERKEPPRSKKTLRIEAENREANAKLNRMRVADERAKEGFIKRNLRRVWETASLQRGIFLGLDLPPILRQAGFVTLGHPIMAAKAFVKTAKAFRSDLKSQEVMAEIAGRENAENGLYKRAMNLELSDLHSQDEYVQSSYLKKIPVFSGLQRWHSGFLTKLRADYFDSLAAGLSKTGKPTEAEAAMIGNAVNVFTGKGNLGAFENAVGKLNNLFLAPKWVVSRFQTVGLQPLRFGAAKHGMQAKARAAVAKEYARTLAGAAAVYGLVSLAKAAGAAVNVETDTTSADFGEIKIGNTRINPMAGLTQVIRFAERLRRGEQKQESGGMKPSDIGVTIKDEFRKKLAPIPSNVWTAKQIYDKQRGVGKGPPKPYPQNYKDQAIQGLIPLTPQEIKKAIDDLGLPAGAAVGLLAMLGAGAKTY